ncbi:MAG: hypothetical protein HOQ03_12165, partial [Thermoleophilia bacterium]|nr:hypothetical protein [Thermoleophilia bacterium]
VAAGARVVTDDVGAEELTALFGDAVQVYRTPDDLVRLGALPDPDVVFGSDAARREVAERVRREHSFEARAGELVRIAHELLSARAVGG